TIEGVRVVKSETIGSTCICREGRQEQKWNGHGFSDQDRPRNEQKASTPAFLSSSSAGSMTTIDPMFDPSALIRS
uniref:Uncharacterized protein n=1 Tax=Oryza brachyantha TaxID=4533 RepID=J3MZF9_ORYBR